MRILDETCFEGSPSKHRHTLFQQKMVLLEERNPAFLTTVWSAPGLWQILQVLIIVWWCLPSSFLSRVHPDMNGTSNSTCIAELPWRKTHLGITSAKRVFSFGLLHGSVACSYCAGLCLLWLCCWPVWIHASWWGHCSESRMLVRLLRWPIWGDKTKGGFTP